MTEVRLRTGWVLFVAACALGTACSEDGDSGADGAAGSDTGGWTGVGGTGGGVGGTLPTGGSGGVTHTGGSGGITPTGGSAGFVEPPTVQQSVGPDGGRIESPLGAVLLIPPGALSETTTISITDDANVSAPPLQVYVQYASPIFGFQPHGMQFAQPVTITLPHNAGGDGTGVGLMKAAEILPWVDATVTQATGSTVQTETDTFSFYVVTVDWGPTAGSGGGAGAGPTGGFGGG